MKRELTQLETCRVSGGFMEPLSVPEFREPKWGGVSPEVRDFLKKMEEAAQRDFEEIISRNTPSF